MKAFGRISGAIGAAVAGAAAATFLHPRAGARNRGAAARVARRQSASVATIVGRAPGRGSQNQRRVAEAVRARLDEHHADVEGVAVAVHKRTVTLRGEVLRLDDIDALEKTARSVDGVTDVNNLLRLAVASARP